jgi:hypothetical protein
MPKKYFFIPSTPAWMPFLKVYTLYHESVNPFYKVYYLCHDSMRAIFYKKLDAFPHFY